MSGKSTRNDGHEHPVCDLPLLRSACRPRPCEGGPPCRDAPETDLRPARPTSHRDRESQESLVRHLDRSALWKPGGAVESSRSVSTNESNNNVRFSRTIQRVAVLKVGAPFFIPADFVLSLDTVTMGMRRSYLACVLLKERSRQHAS